MRRIDLHLCVVVSLSRSPLSGPPECSRQRRKIGSRLSLQEKGAESEGRGREWRGRAKCFSMLSSEKQKAKERSVARVVDDRRRKKRKKEKTNAFFELALLCNTVSSHSSLCSLSDA